VKGGRLGVSGGKLSRSILCFLLQGSMKVLIIGTGWFGCEVAIQLERMGVDFDMVDKSNRFFAGSSSRNQNRLDSTTAAPRPPERSADRGMIRS